MRAAGIFIYFFFVVLVYTQLPPVPQPSPQPASVQPSPVPDPSPVPAPSNSTVPAPEPSPVPAPDAYQNIYDIIDLSLKAVLIVTGLFWVLFGFRFMHETKSPYVTLLLAGFLIFYYIAYQLLYRFTVTPGYTQNWLAYTLSAVAGIIGASLFFLSYQIHVGKFFFSALSGVLFSTLLFIYTPLGAVSLAHQYQLVIIGGVGLILGFLSIPLNIIIPIIVSSFNGSFLICNAIDSLAKFSTVADLLRNIMQSPSWDTNFNVPLDIHRNWQIYVILGCIIVVTIIGVIIQYRLTAREIIDNERIEKQRTDNDNRDPEQVPLLN